MATFNVFGPTTLNDIRVGYISTDRGLVEGVTICDANSYAKLNPGTQFIFRNREEIQYLNINEVNALTPDSLGLEKPKKSCQGYDQDPGPRLTPQECGKAKAYFYGGAGIGVKGTPIIGQDGGLMAVVLTSGGFGYQYPPVTEVKDDCGTAGAAVVRSVIGEQVSTVEVYDDEEDFEEYDLNHNTCPPAPPKIINRNAAGKVTGEFNPRDYTNPEEVDDPIRREILLYQERLRAVKKPFWTTRMNPPLRVIGPNRNDRTKYDVQHFAWGGEQVTTAPPATSKEFVDVKMNVFTAGGHGRGMLFNFSSEDGTHKFTIKADNFKEKRTTSITQKVKRNTLYKVVAQGSYKGAGVEQGLVGKLGKKPKEIKAKGAGKEATGSVIFCDFAKSANDNDDLQVEVTQGKFTAKNRDRIKGHDTYELEYVLGDNSAFISRDPKTTEVIKDTFMNRYAISPVPPSNVPGSDFAGVQFTFEWEENFPYSGEYVFRSARDNEAKLYIDNKFVMDMEHFRGRKVVGTNTGKAVKKVIGAGVHKIRIDLFNTPGNIEETVISQPQVQSDDEHEIIYIDLHPKNKKLRVSNNRREIKFVDGDGNDANARLKILEGNVVFSEDGKKLIGSGAVKIRFEWDDDPGNAGIAVRQVKIIGGTGPDNVRLLGSNRGRRSEKGRDTDTFTLARLERPTSISSNSGDVKNVTVFDTISSIDKADRPLWRINPGAGKDSDFYNRFGILPFDMAAPASLTDDYAGTHPIRWNDLNFPVDGNYDIEVQVDDAVTMRFIDRNGNETIIEKQGFTAPLDRGGRDTGKSVITQFFKAGKYRLVADLFQRRGKPIAVEFGNPMVLAIRIGTSYIETTRLVKQSWQQNPMGAALTIDAPPVPRPELPIPKAPGRCPNNPFWTSRFPGASNYWYPVIVPERWGKFMNRYAISPLPPLAVRSTDGGGVVYQTTWDLDVPYSGFFGLKATADNGARILIDGEEVMSGGLGYSRNGVKHFKNEPDRPRKIFISQGKHKITLEVRNEDTEEKQAYKQKVFSTADWVVPGVITENSFDVVYIGLHPKNKKLKVSSDRKRIDFSDRDGEFNDGKLRITSGNATFSKDGKKITGTGVIRARLDWDDDPNTDGVCIRGVIINGVELTRDSKTENREKRIPIDIAAPGTRGRGDRAAIVGFTVDASGNRRNALRDLGASARGSRFVTGVSDKEIKYTDSTLQNDTDARFQIVSTSPGVKAKFSPNGEELIVKGNGDVTLRLKWSDDPKENGQAVGELKIAGKTFRQRGKSGEQVETIKVSGKTIDKLSKKGSDSNNINLSAKAPAELVGLTGGTSKDGVTYEGPTLASYRAGFLTPAYANDEQYLAEFQGTTWKMVWKGVNFPQQGRYTIQVEADDIGILRVDGQEVGRAEVFKGNQVYEVDITAGKKTVEIELFNQGEVPGPFSGPAFPINPTVVAARIDYNGTRGTGKSKSWDDNPMGISAELIPPPCPKEVGGKGVVTEVIVDDPGNGFETPPLGPPPPDAQPDPDAPPVVPVALQLKSVDIVQPGINLRCGEDPIVIEPSNGAELSYDCDTFGRPTKINVDRPGFFVQPPEIRFITETGIPPVLRPQFEVIIDPIGIPADQLIQVTDLPGIKRTGFVNGRSYFGAVYYENGLKFAGLFATVGEPVRVYDTLQESIDAQVTTPPSAIQRQGTDITANDPRLNIPDTPDEIV